MKNIKVVLSILLLSVSGLVMAGPKKIDFDIVSVSGTINKMSGVVNTDLFTATGGHSKWYDVNDLLGGKGVKLDIFDCTAKNCSSLSDYKLVKTLTQGQSWTLTSTSASNHWMGEVITTACASIGSKFHWTVSSVPEPETVVLMLLGIFMVALKSRSRKTTGTLENLA